MPRQSLQQWSNELDTIINTLETQYTDFLTTPQQENQRHETANYTIQLHWFDPSWDMNDSNLSKRPLLEVQARAWKPTEMSLISPGKIKHNRRYASFFLYKPKTGNDAYPMYKNWRVQGPIHI